jgi:saccharopine dehydrogenase (NAD+, L-lysine forming)
MRILVVGAGGVGAAVASIAARRPFFERLVIADVDGLRAGRAADRARGSTLPTWPTSSSSSDTPAPTSS